MNVPCQLCGNYDGKIQAKQLCSICYALERKLLRVQKWNLDLQTIPGFLLKKPSGRPLIGNLKRLKASAIRAISKRLKYRKSLKSSMEKTDINGLDLEHLVHDIMQKIGGVDKKKVNSAYHGGASLFDEFAPKQRIELFKYLKKVYYLIPMPALNPKIFDEDQNL